MPRPHHPHQYYADHAIPEDIYIHPDEEHDENNLYRQRAVNHSGRQHSGRDGCASSDRDVADALARRVLEERDDAMKRAARAEAAYEEVTQRLRHALEEREDAGVAAARAERIAHDALEEVAQRRYEREELEAELFFSRNLLADASYANNSLLTRVRQLERWREVASHVIDSAASPPPPPPSSESDTAFGLTRTKEAIEKAVREAAELPEDERKRKLKLLKAKWHPDKHEVLKEMAEEVSKMINSAIDEMGGDDDKPPATAEPQ